MSRVYHSNGQLAWFGSPGDRVYHSNGQLTWFGSLGDRVYHSNGELAWHGSPGDRVYLSNGELLTSNGNGCSIQIGEGIVLSIGTESASLNVLGNYIKIYESDSITTENLVVLRNCNTIYVTDEETYEEKEEHDEEQEKHDEEVQYTIYTNKYSYKSSEEVKKEYELQQITQKVAERKIKADKLREDGKPFTAFLVEMDPYYLFIAAGLYLNIFIFVVIILKGVTKYSILGLLVSAGLCFFVYFIYDYFKIRREHQKQSIIISVILSLIIFIGIGLKSNSKNEVDTIAKEEEILEKKMKDKPEIVKKSNNNANIENISPSEKLKTLENKTPIGVELKNQEAINSENILYKIQDTDGYSNLRSAPGGDVTMKVYDTETFDVIGTEGKYKKVRLSDGTEGYIHESRVVIAK